MTRHPADPGRPHPERPRPADPGRPGRPRPERATGPIGGSILALGAWAVVAHTSGSGWVQTLGAVLTGVLVVGLAGPAVAVTRAKVTVVRSPADATAGSGAELRITASARVRVEPVDPGGPRTFAGPRHGPDEDDHDEGATTSLTVVPEHRGLVPWVTVDIASASPFGLMWWHRQLRLPLTQVMHVAPRMGVAGRIWPPDDLRSAELRRRSPAVVGEPRGVRPYRPGDSRRWVHWPATAHSGVVMVRDMETPAANLPTVRVVLPEDTDQADAAAGDGLAAVAALLRDGTAVLLVTDEAGGTCAAVVGDRRAAGRRLGRAVAAPDRPAITASPGPGTPAPGAGPKWSPP